MPNKQARDIVLAAYTYLAEVTPPSQKISDVRIEEVLPYEKESKEDAAVKEIFWKVILSFDNIGENPFDRKREFKQFKVTDTDARVIYMKRPEDAN